MNPESRGWRKKILQVSIALIPLPSLLLVSSYSRYITLTFHSTTIIIIYTNLEDDIRKRKSSLNKIKSSLRSRLLQEISSNLIFDLAQGITTVLFIFSPSCRIKDSGFLSLRAPLMLVYGSCEGTPRERIMETLLCSKKIHMRPLLPRRRYRIGEKRNIYLCPV